MKKCVSLFSCGGFGDIGLHAADINTIVANELIPERAACMQKNFPNTKVITGDIYEKKQEIISCAKDILKDEHLFAMIISAPCQACSSNGMGRMTAQIKKGKRPKDDPRNRLILPAIEIVHELKPKCLIIENVAGMRNTCILNDNDEYESILSILYNNLHDYVFRSTVMNVADYGIPQNRKRLITIAIHKDHTDENRMPNYFSNEASIFHPYKTHGFEKNPYVTLRKCIRHLPLLDAKHKLKDEQESFHRIPKWNEMQYFCMSNTKEDSTAFDNKYCIKCHKITENMKVIYCDHCNSVLPRPHLYSKKDDNWRLVRAFKTSYRRMSWDRPGNALTTNSGVISSDVKGHPDENRVLSLKEIMIVASIHGYPGEDVPWHYEFPDDDKLIRDLIGECIPPKLSYIIGQHLINLIDFNVS